MIKQFRNDLIIVFFLLAFIYSYFYHDSGWNGNARFGLIYSIVHDRHLTIDAYLNQIGTDSSDKAFYNGHYYSDKAIGPSIIGVVLYLPLYLIKMNFNDAKIILTFLIVGFPSAIAGSLIYLLSIYISKSRFRAILVTIAITLGTLYLPYSVIFFSHQYSSSLLFCVFVMIFFYKEYPNLGKSWYLFLIGWLIGWAFIGEYTTALIIFPLIIYYLFSIWRNHNWRQFPTIVFPMLGVIIPILLQLIYNERSFNSFFSIGYLHLKGQFASSMGQGLMGIGWPKLNVLFYTTFHPTMGIFWQSPILLLSIIGAWYMFRKQRYRAEAALSTGIICSYLVILSGYYMWWGGWSLGPRHLIPMLPFFCIPLIFVPKRLNWLFVILSIVSIGQMMIATASVVLVPDWTINEIASLDFFAFSNIYNYCLEQLQEGNFAWNLGHQLLGLQSWYSLIPILVIIMGIAYLFIRGKTETSN